MEAVVKCLSVCVCTPPMCCAAGASAQEARTLAAMSDMIPRDNALFSVTGLTDSALAVVHEASQPGPMFSRHSGTVSWSDLQVQPSSVGALAAGNLSRSGHARMSEFGTQWMASVSSIASHGSSTQPSQWSPMATVGEVPVRSLRDGDSSSVLGDSGSVVIHESLTQLDVDSPQNSQVGVRYIDGGSKQHIASAVIPDVPIQPERSSIGSSKSGGSVASCPGRPIGEGGEEELSKKFHSVSFDMAKTRAHHRHKSSNYSRLLDYRVDEWFETLPV